MKDLKRRDTAVKPFEQANAIVSYEYADRQIDTIGTLSWNLAVIDEARRLRNVHNTSGSTRIGVR